MFQPSTIPADSPADLDHYVHFPTLCAAPALSGLPPQPSGRPRARTKIRAETDAIGQVSVLEVSGRLADVHQDLDRSIEQALAEGPRGLVCDLMGVAERCDAGSVKALGAAGRHVRHWRGIPIAVACPDPQLRQALSADPLGRHLIVTATKLPAIAAVLATPLPAVARLHLGAHPTAPRASRDFASSILQGLGVGWVIPSASLVLSELVTNAMIHAGTDIDVSVEWNLGALRLTVRDQHPGLPRQQQAGLAAHGRGLQVVAGLSRAVGVLPTADGGKVVWAVLNAPRTDSHQPRRS